MVVRAMKSKPMWSDDSLAARKPIKWFGTTSCHWCGHLRKEHDGDEGLGHCHSDRALSPCDCASFADEPLSVAEARNRLYGGQGIVKPVIVPFS